MYSPQQERSYFNQTKQLLQGQLNGIPKASLHRELVSLINYHEWKYYVQNNPVISDHEYDQLFKLLEEVESEHPDLVTASSPSQRVSSDLTSDFKSVRHLTTMLSLANSYNANDLISFDESVKKILGLDRSAPVSYTVEPKFDGGSIALVFAADQLTRAATRGNGVKGDDITANVRTIRSVPLSASFAEYGIGRIELRGEAIIPKSNFKKINEARAEADLPLFANPRNAATGGLRMKDPADTARRGIEAFIYQISYVEDLQGREDHSIVTTQWSGIELLQELGFKVPTRESKHCENIEEVAAFCADWEAKRDAYQYEIDGMVVKVDDMSLQRRIGSTSHHPRWAIAYKFKAKQATTKLLHVEYQVGKIGSITPVAKLEPVQLAGVTVSSVSLHNEDFIRSKDLRLGDTVVVERAGDVIPYIVKPLSELRDGSEVPIEFPRFCPINNTVQVQLVREQGEAAWRCPACSCGAQDLQRLIFHVSKPAMNIDGFGRSIVERFYELGWLQNLADVYQLDFEQIKNLEGFGSKSADKLAKAIAIAKKNPIWRLLHSLSIHHLGQRASKVLAAEINHVLDLKDWSVEDYTAIKDIGPVLAQNMVRYFSNPVHLNFLQKMEASGVNLQQTEEDRPIEVAADAPFKNKTILFTGTLTKMGRKEAQALAEKYGAKNLSSVSSNLDILVVGQNAGSKLKKAQALESVEILSEDEFIKRISL